MTLLVWLIAWCVAAVVLRFIATREPQAHGTDVTFTPVATGFTKRPGLARPIRYQRDDGDETEAVPEGLGVVRGIPSFAKLGTHSAVTNWALLSADERALWLEALEQLERGQS